ncbi:MAG: hypothetical protein ACQKBT_00735 [Puniceicoccales bacterium]
MRFLSSIRALAILPLLVAGLAAAPAAKPSRPGFVDSLEPSNQAQVARVVVGSEADLVVLSTGWLEGFRTGMACIVTDGNVRTGEILLVDVRLNHAVGLILNRPEDAGIQPGNLVTIKTFSVSS